MKYTEITKIYKIRKLFTVVFPDSSRSPLILVSLIAGGIMYQFFSPNDFAKQRELIRADLRKICDTAELLYVAVNEAVNNAFIHGYEGAEYSPVTVRIYQETEQVVIKIRHEGQGLQAVSQPQDGNEPSLEEHGRGLNIIRCCTDYCEYSGDGRELVMRKTISIIR